MKIPCLYHWYVVYRAASCFVSCRFCFKNSLSHEIDQDLHLEALWKTIFRTPLWDLFQKAFVSCAHSTHFWMSAAVTKRVTGSTTTTTGGTTSSGGGSTNTPTQQNNQQNNFNNNINNQANTNRVMNTMQSNYDNFYKPSLVPWGK